MYVLDQNYYVVSLMMIYLDIVYAIYSLTLSYWIYTCIKRLKSKGSMSESSGCSHTREKHRFSFDEIDDNEQIFSTKSQDMGLVKNQNYDYVLKNFDDSYSVMPQKFQTNN